MFAQQSCLFYRSGDSFFAVFHSSKLIQGIIALKRLNVKMSKGNVIPSLNGSQLYSSHPKQKCTKIYPEETAPGPRPLPYMGKILTFDRKVVETPFFTKMTAFEF